MAGNMIAAYYSKGCDSRELFKNLKIAEDPSFESNLNNTNVIKIDLNAEYMNVPDKSNLIKFFSEKIKRELRAEFPTVEIDDDYTLPTALESVYGATGAKFVKMMYE